MESVNHDGDELDHLENGQVFLPPQIFLVLWSECGKHVISVHDDVNSGVEEPKER